MRKISFLCYATVLGLSAVSGIILSSLSIYISKPVKPLTTNLPIIDYDKINTHKGGIILGQSPFKGTLTAPVLPEAPVPPSVPGMPDIAAADKLVVLGVLPPDVCIIRKGADTVTARIGDDTKLGHIGNITPRGVYIDGNFIKIQ